MTRTYLNRVCILCQDNTPYSEVVKENIAEEMDLVKTFSARRSPDRRTFRWISCNNCGLFMSSPYYSLDLESLYTNSEFTYGDELLNIERTYGKLIIKATRNRRISTMSFFDVGAGNGFALRVAKQLGFTRLRGLEPSKDAIRKSDIEIREYLEQGFIENYGDVSQRFDIITLFHVLDHVANPREVIKRCLELLNPDGIILIAVHNTNSWSRALLRSRSPIFDVEHTYLFNKSTLSELMEVCGFSNIRCWSYSNTYSLGYLLQVLVRILGFKSESRVLQNAFNLLSRIRLTLPLGNIAMIGHRPKQD